MRYTLDCEFDGFGGPLISMALVREDNEACYIVFSDHAADPWVRENVIPCLFSVPSPMPGMVHDLRSYTPKARRDAAALILERYFYVDARPYIVTDWPADVAYFSDAVLLSEPGKMCKIPSLRFEVARVDAYPTAVKGAVQHNAYWDAQALRALVF